MDIESASSCNTNEFKSNHLEPTSQDSNAVLRKLLLNDDKEVTTTKNGPSIVEGKSLAASISCQPKVKKPQLLKHKLKPSVCKSSISKEANSKRKEVTFTEPDSEHMEYQIFSNLVDVENYLLEQEALQTTRFILNRQCKGFGKDDPGKGIFSPCKMAFQCNIWTDNSKVSVHG